MRRRRVAGSCSLVIALAISPALAACSDDPATEDGSATTAPDSTTSSAPTTTIAPSTTTATTDPVASTTTAPSGPAPTDLVPDGMSFGFVTAVDLDASTITIDIAELLTGDDAVKAAIEDGALEPGETSIDNDYYIRNQNPKVRVAPVAGTATLNVLVNEGSPEPSEGTFAQFADHVAERTGYESGLPVQIVAAGGVVSRIDEVFFP